ncbi:amidase [Hoeflea sp. YIM 152468]|uniref:amidase n=1 Tax=Hoeflea sp. YIM 152468 TaxID=3031759 RepID=UPI0023DB6143|nr:amidase [Hoeflea sp. YIM 152468]MDF1608646.1 amidase [Hoeflea sp. YIM 152468]
MNFSEYRSMDGIALSDELSKRELPPRDAMRIAQNAAEVVDGVCNAITYRRYTAAMDDAENCIPKGGRFDGVPFLLKDSGLASTDLPSSTGSRLLDNTSFARDATLAGRFRDAGFINFARTAVPEFCMAPTTEALRNGGPTRNPFDLTRSSGGSSGGAAVAVAAGVVPIAHGSDGGGSIRVPAASCGIFGLKPSRGLVPMGPFRGEGWGGLACDGVLSRSVRDTARVLDLVGGMEPGAPYASPSFSRSFEDAVRAGSVPPLRIGLWTDPWGLDVDSPCLAAAEATAEACRSLGHLVVPLQPPVFDYPSFIAAIITIMSVNIAASVDKKLAGSGRRPTADDLEPAILDGYRLGVSTSGESYVQAINFLHATGRMMTEMMAECDILISPTLTSLPVKLGTISTEVPKFEEFRETAGKLTAFLAVINASGQPAASLPMWRHEGLPVGVQLIGHFGRDDIVLALSGQLEKSRLWMEAAQFPLLAELERIGMGA